MAVVERVLFVEPNHCYSVWAISARDKLGHQAAGGPRLSPAAHGTHLHHRRTGTHPPWRDATFGGGIQGKLASLVVGDDPGHPLRMRRDGPIWGGSRVTGDSVEVVPNLAGGDTPDHDWRWRLRQPPRADLEQQLQGCGRGRAMFPTDRVAHASARWDVIPSRRMGLSQLTSQESASGQDTRRKHGPRWASPAPVGFASSARNRDR